MSFAVTPALDEVAVRHAVAPDDMDTVRRLFMLYGKSFDFSICFEAFERELSSLPGDYAPPAGRLLLAEIGGEAVGVVALRPLAEQGTAEIKRLYVDPAARGHGVGRRLTDEIVAEARRAGYRKLCLETLAVMEAANRIYDELGFAVVPAPEAASATGIICKELLL